MDAQSQQFLDHLVPGRDFGALPQGVKAEESALWEEIPTVVPDKPGFEQGSTLYGVYLGSRRVYSDKFQNSKGYRVLHTLESLAPDPQTGKAQKYGIWGVGGLDAILPRLDKGTKLGIRYDGVAEKALKKGQNPPHQFTYLSVAGSHFAVDMSREPVIVDSKMPDKAISDRAADNAE